MALTGLVVVPDGYELKTASHTLPLDLIERGSVYELVFRGAWKATKKGALLKKLIRKQFEPLVPRLRIRLK